jgi:hypothetical protein
MHGPQYRPLKSTWFIVVLTAMLLACADTPDTPGGSYDPDNTYATISRSKAVLNQWFSAKVSVYSNYVQTVEYHASVDGSLPPGICWDGYGTFSGTPTQTGLFTMGIWYRDVNKGTYSYPNLADNKWYYKSIELEVSRFEQPEYTTTVNVTCTNNTVHTITFYVDGASVATLGPGDSSTTSVRSGKRIFQYSLPDGGLSGEEVWNLESGQNYTYSVKPR